MEQASFSTSSLEEKCVQREVLIATFPPSHFQQNRPAPLNKVKVSDS